MFLNVFSVYFFETTAISRILSVGRAAINRAWKQGEITAAPFIKDVPVGAKQPRGRPLSIEELRSLYHRARHEHIRRFILWMLGTAARPDAVLELRRDQIDFEHGLIHLNPQQRAQTKKYRPSVKLPNALRQHLGEDETIIAYRGRPIRSVKTAWRDLRNACGLDDQVNPYSLRHTIARHMRAAGVPAWEVSAQLGHKQPGMGITEIYAPFAPDYLANAVIAIDSLLEEVLLPTALRPLAPVSRQSGHLEDAKSLRARSSVGQSTTLTS